MFWSGPMRRVVSVWFPAWSIERMRRQSPMRESGDACHRALGPDGDPFVLVATGRHGLTVTAANAAAMAESVRPGMALADARALFPALRSGLAEPEEDRRALLRLARWCGRYGPDRNVEIAPVAGGAADDLVRDHGLWIDITGVSHLFGGDEALARDLCLRLAGFDLTARVGLADTFGAAHALARFSAPPIAMSTQKPWISAPPGLTPDWIEALPVEALRLESATVVALKRLGLRRIGDLYGLPRAALERRFREAKTVSGVLARLDQALGRKAEPRRPLVGLPELWVRRGFADPLISADGLEAETGALLAELCDLLETHGIGARRIRLVLYRADGTVAQVAAGTSAPVREARHIMRLFADKLGTLDAGFGVDMLAVEVLVAERFAASDIALANGVDLEASGNPSELIDRLSNRLGPARVFVLRPRQSQIPERAEVRWPALSGATVSKSCEPVAAGHDRLSKRPEILLSRPEPITVTAEVPDGVPAAFTWRRVTRRVIRAEGPERIAPEWWRSLARRMPEAKERPGPQDPAPPLGAPLGEPVPRSSAPRTRDYYSLEDTSGAGYWVFRNGLYGDTAEEGPPAWFMHGLFP